MTINFIEVFGKELIEKIKKNEWLETPEKLLQFYMLTFVDFKNYLVRYKYFILINRFCLPTIKLDKIQFDNSKKLVKALSKEELASIAEELKTVVVEANEKRKGFVSSFILMEYAKETGKAKACHSFKDLLEDKPNTDYYVIYIDPTNRYPSVLLKNLIGAIGMSAKKTIKFISLRDKIPKECTKVEFKDSLYFETSIEKLTAVDFDFWILDEEGKLQEWNIDLKQIMDRVS